MQLKGKGDSKKEAILQEKPEEDKGPLLPYDLPDGKWKNAISSIFLQVSTHL